MSKSFMFGFFTCFVFSQVHMDMMGKALYLKRVDEFWMNTSPYLWLFIWLVGALVHAWIKYEENIEN